jgi:hypothetical protein
MPLWKTEKMKWQHILRLKKRLDELLDQWNEEGKVVIGFKRYHKLLLLVKSASEVDHIWFSFFEGMHRHAAIVAVLVCSKFNHPTNNLEPGSLTLEDFINGEIKSFKEPHTTVQKFCRANVSEPISSISIRSKTDYECG